MRKSYLAGKCVTNWDDHEQSPLTAPSARPLSFYADRIILSDQSGSSQGFLLHKMPTRDPTGRSS